MNRPSPHRPRAGFTLLEMVLSVALLSLLMGAMTFSLTVASRSIDGGTGPAGKAIRGAALIEEMNADLAMATGFSERTATAVTFTVPDRDGDKAPERLRYWWTGEADGRLLRQVNDAPAAVIAEDARHFSLSYSLRTVEAVVPPGFEPVSAEGTDGDPQGTDRSGKKGRKPSDHQPPRWGHGDDRPGKAKGRQR